MSEAIKPEIMSDIPERVVVIAAHADDIEFGVAGTTSLWTQAGAEVTYVLVTDSSSGSNDPDVNPADLIEQRHREQIVSAAEVGVKDVRFLGYPDGTLQPTLELRRDLTRILREKRPDVVVTMDPTMIIARSGNYINHPDHRAAGEAAMYAVFPSSETRPIFPELLDEGYEPHKVKRVYLMLTNEPTHVTDISNSFEQKAAALRHHESQFGDETDRIIEMIGNWNAEAGEPHGIAYAESFRVLILQREESPESEETAAEAADSPQD